MRPALSILLGLIHFHIIQGMNHCNQESAVRLPGPPGAAGSALARLTAGPAGRFLRMVR